MDKDSLEVLLGRGLSVEEGMSIAQIAAAADRTKATVRYWLRRYGMSTRPAERMRSQQEARQAGLVSIKLTCRHHGETEHALCADGGNRCKRCRSESVVRRRRKMKRLTVAEAGGACCICGYDRYIGALEFHHVAPSEKRLTLSRNGITLALETLRAEAKKCVLVCSNCHAELEGGVTRLASRVANGQVEMHVRPEDQSASK